MAPSQQTSMLTVVSKFFFRRVTDNDSPALHTWNERHRFDGRGTWEQNCGVISQEFVSKMEVSQWVQLPQTRYGSGRSKGINARILVLQSGENVEV